MAAFISEIKSWQDVGGVPIVNGLIYFGEQNTDPTILANQIPIFADRALTVPLANPQPTNSYGDPVNKIYLSGRYSIKVEDENGEQRYQNLDNGEAEGTQTLSLFNVLGSNTITANASPTIPGLTDNAQFIFQAVSENDQDDVTLDIDGTGAKPINRNFDQPVGKGKFKVGQTIKVSYNLGQDNYQWSNENARVFFQTKGDDIPAASLVDLALAKGNDLDITGAGGPITDLGEMLAGLEFTLKYLGTASVGITSSSVANPTNILCDVPHGFSNGQIVLIEGHSGSTPNINGNHVITIVDTTNFTIPVNVTVGGTGGTVRAVPSMTNNDTSLQLMSGGDRTFSPGDTQKMLSLGSGNWKEIAYNPINGIVPFGICEPFIGLEAPQGYVMLKGGTIGSPTSGATERAMMDTKNLFTRIWNSILDADAPVSGGRGASAEADFNANKNITLLDLKGKTVFGTGGTAPAIHGSSFGAETHTLVKSEMPSHDHDGVGATVLVDAGANGFAAGGAGSVNLISEGGDGAHNNMPPGAALNWITKL